VSDSDQSGFSVSSAGDINGDGIDDLVIGSSGTTVNGVNLRQSHIIFGDDNGFLPMSILLTLMVPTDSQSMASIPVTVLEQIQFTCSRILRLRSSSSIRSC